MWEDIRSLSVCSRRVLLILIMPFYGTLLPKQGCLPLEHNGTWDPSWIQAPEVNWDQTIPFARHRADCGSRKLWTSRESRSDINKSIKADVYHTNSIKALEKAPDFPVVLGRAMAQHTNRFEELLSLGKDCGGTKHC